MAAIKIALEKGCGITKIMPIAIRNPIAKSIFGVFPNLVKRMRANRDARLAFTIPCENRNAKTIVKKLLDKGKLNTCIADVLPNNKNTASKKQEEEIFPINPVVQQ